MNQSTIHEFIPRDALEVYLTSPGVYIGGMCSQPQPGRAAAVKSSALDLIGPYLSGRRRSIAAGLLCLMTVDLLQLVIPRIIRAAVDGLTTFSVTPATLVAYALWIVAISVVIGGFRFLWRHFLMGLSREVERGLRDRLFRHLQTLSAAYFHKTQTGNLMAHATNDIHHIRMAAGMGLVALMDAVLLGAGTIGFMAYINVRLTLFTIIPMPLIVLSTRIFSKKMHLAYQSVQKRYSTLTERVREHFTGIRIIKAYAREEASARVIETVSRAYIDENVRLVWITGAFFPMMLFFSNISLALVIYLGGRQTIFNRITPGDFVAFISYLGLLTWPMMAIGWLINLIQRGKASLERVGTILDTRPEVRDRPGARPFPEPLKAIDAAGIRFRYEEETPPVLDGISLHVPGGTALGVIGPPGAGKSTLLALLSRTSDTTEGRVLYNGIDVRDLKIAELRSRIAFVPQEPFLFAGSLRDNITFGADVPEEELRKALRTAALEHTLRTLPRGLDTVVGEKGVILSGGQKQRVALARAFLRERPILILDDPISQVDAETGEAILGAIRALSGRRTLIIVSHRIAAVRFADRIITLQNGRITESGTHRELVSRNGYYARTAVLQQIDEVSHVE